MHPRSLLPSLLRSVLRSLLRSPLSSLLSLTLLTAAFLVYSAATISSRRILVVKGNYPTPHTLPHITPDLGGWGLLHGDTPHPLEGENIRDYGVDEQTSSHFTTSHSTPSQFIQSHSTSLHFTPSHSTPSHFTPSHSTPSHSTPSHFTPPQFIQPHSTPSHSTSSHSTPSQPTSSHTTPSHSTSSHTTPSHSTLSPAHPLQNSAHPTTAPNSNSSSHLAFRNLGNLGNLSNYRNLGSYRTLGKYRNPGNYHIRGNYTRDELRRRFPLRTGFSFPHPSLTLPPSLLDTTSWMDSLRDYLASCGEQQVTLVTSNLRYIDVLLNWLISAVVRSKLPADGILVVAMDRQLHVTLLAHGLRSVYIPPRQLFQKDANFSSEFEQVMMVRLAVMRIICHYGYDVHNYDTDAILLKDPRPLYLELGGSDIIGSVGRIPEQLMEEWGITLCIGVVVVKSNERTEAYWQAMSSSCPSSHDDQEKLNCALHTLHITWVNARGNQTTNTVHGQCRNRLRVSILPYQLICRQTNCDPQRRGSYYIWHKGGSRSRRQKLKGSRDGGSWFLRYKWYKIQNQLQGHDWLASIAYWGVTHS